MIVAQSMPVDDILPALYAEHPRRDINLYVERLLQDVQNSCNSNVPAATGAPYDSSPGCTSGLGDQQEDQGFTLRAKFPLRALSFSHDLVWQLASVVRELGDGAFPSGALARERVEFAWFTRVMSLQHDSLEPSARNGAAGAAAGSEATIDKSMMGPNMASILPANLLACVLACLGIRSVPGDAGGEGVGKGRQHYWQFGVRDLWQGLRVMSCVSRGIYSVIRNRGVWRAECLRVAARCEAQYETQGRPAAAKGGARHSNGEEPRIVFEESWQVTLARYLSLERNLSQIYMSERGDARELGARELRELPSFARARGMSTDSPQPAGCSSEHFAGRREEEVTRLLRLLDDSVTRAGVAWIGKIAEVDAECELMSDIGEFRRRFERRRRACVLRGGRVLLSRKPAPSCENLRALESTWGHKWMSVVVPGAHAPPYTVQMQLSNYVEYMDALTEDRAFREGLKWDEHGLGGYDALYLFDKDFPRDLETPFGTPAVFDDDFLAEMVGSLETVPEGGQTTLEKWPALLTEREWMVIGPATSG